MTLATVGSLVEALQGQGVLRLDQLDELVRDLQHRHADAHSLAADLIQRDWLTPFQVNQLLQERVLTLGGYVLVERIGEGGMGQVFKARHLRLGRLAAIKVIRPDVLAQPSALLRFQREARAAAQLSDPNIVAVYDFAEDNGTHFLVMEYVQGIDLARHLRENGSLSVADACEYARQTALGLQHAHERGLVHRDIKPHNLILASGSCDPPLPRVKILDMGLARGPQVPGEDGITHEGVVIGTLDYLAPEQARNTRRLDARSDLYSLGCTLYQFLAGAAPFAEATGFEKLLKHQLDEPTPLESLRPELDAEILALVRKLMAKQVEQRFQTAAEVVSALEGYLARRDRPEPLAKSDPISETRGNSASAATVSLKQAATPALQETTQLPALSPYRSRRRRFVVLAFAGLLLTLIVLSDRKDKTPDRDENQEQEAPPQKPPPDPLLRVMPEQTVGLVRIEMNSFLKHPWIKTHYRDVFRRIARDNDKVKEHVPAAGEEFWEQLDRLAIALGPDVKTGDVWAVQAPHLASLIAALAGPPRKEDAPLRALKDSARDSTTFFAALDADTAAFSDRRPPLLEIVGRKPEASPARPAALLQRRQPGDTLWLHFQRDAVARFPESVTWVSNDVQQLRTKVEELRLSLALDKEVRLQLVLVAQRGEGVATLEKFLGRYMDVIRDSPLFLILLSDVLVPILPLLNTGKVTTSGREVRLDCVMETQALLKAVEELQAKVKTWTKP